MGVIYRAGDDVGELLVPFVREHGKVHDAAEIERIYTLASLGELPAAELWRQLGVAPALEDRYLERHALMDGLTEFLPALADRGYRIACLSNDLSEWSLKLRRRFGLEAHIDTWVISGDVGSRKPERPIYDALRAALGMDLGETVFLDDKPQNLRTAAECGIQTILVGAVPNGGDASGGQSWPCIARLSDALPLLPGRGEPLRAHSATHCHPCSEKTRQPVP